MTAANTLRFIGECYGCDCPLVTGGESVEEFYAEPGDELVAICDGCADMREEIISAGLAFSYELLRQTSQAQDKAIENDGGNRFDFVETYRTALYAAGGTP